MKNRQLEPSGACTWCGGTGTEMTGPESEGPCPHCDGHGCEPYGLSDAIDRMVAGVKRMSLVFEMEDENRWQAWVEGMAWGILACFYPTHNYDVEEDLVFAKISEYIQYQLPYTGQ